MNPKADVTMMNKLTTRGINPIDFPCVNGTKAPDVGFGVKANNRQKYQSYSLAYSTPHQQGTTDQTLLNLLDACKAGIANNGTASSPNCGVPFVQQCPDLYKTCTNSSAPIASASKGTETVTLHAVYSDPTDAFQACAQKNLLGAFAGGTQAPVQSSGAMSKLNNVKRAALLALSAGFVLATQV